jgi:hypothetical protein
VELIHGTSPNAVTRVHIRRGVRGVTPAAVQPLVDSHRGARQLMQLRTVLDVMDGGAESPQETRTRLLLLGAGFRRPQTQIEVRDHTGYAFARIDMGWEEHRVGAELLRYRRGVVLQRSYDARDAAGCPWLAECVLVPRQIA